MAESLKFEGTNYDEWNYLVIGGRRIVYSLQNLPKYKDILVHCRIYPLLLPYEALIVSNDDNSIVHNNISYWNRLCLCHSRWLQIDAKSESEQKNYKWEMGNILDKNPDKSLTAVLSLAKVPGSIWSLIREYNDKKIE